MSNIELIVFDWAGTTTDFGSQAPITVFDKTFSRLSIKFTKDEINAPMGMEKKGHIRTMLSTENGTKMWQEQMGRMWTEDDIEDLYQSFETTLSIVVADYSKPIKGVPETVDKLREMGIKIGSTTGYTSQMMEYVKPVAAAGGYSPDCVVTPDITGHSRPTPFMIYEVMRQLNVYPASSVVKVGDTVMDILEGKNAGAWTVGIIQGSNLVGLSEQEQVETDPIELKRLEEKARDTYEKAGADFIIDSIYDLPQVIESINERLKDCTC